MARVSLISSVHVPLGSSPISWLRAAWGLNEPVNGARPGGDRRRGLVVEDRAGVVLSDGRVLNPLLAESTIRLPVGLIRVMTRSGSKVWVEVQADVDVGDHPGGGAGDLDVRAGDVLGRVAAVPPVTDSGECGDRPGSGPGCGRRTSVGGPELTTTDPTEEIRSLMSGPTA